MEKAMAPHSSTLAWKIPCTEDPGGPLSMGSLPFLEAGKDKDRKVDPCGQVVRQSTWARAPRNPPLSRPHPLG